MANHRPLAIKILATAADSGITLGTDLSQSSWGLLLLEGTAKFSNQAIASAAVNVWESATATGTPDHTTFTNSAGAYGVTVKANKPLVLKVFGQ